MIKKKTTLLLSGMTISATIFISGFTFPKKNIREFNVGNSKYINNYFCPINNQKSSSGSKTGWTNSVPDGPGTCSSGGGCHSGGLTTPVFSFSATPAFINNTYVPGTNYTIAIQVTGYLKFGFDLEMLNDTTITSTAIGTFAALTHSQIKPAGNFPKSVTHTSSISSMMPATFSWIAPSDGNVYVYGDGNGVNGDGTNYGDKAVLYSEVLTPFGASQILEKSKPNMDVSIFPNPVAEVTNLKYELTENSVVSAKMISVTGNIVCTFFNNELQYPGKQDIKLIIDPTIANGIYLLLLEVNGKQTFKKIVVE